MLLYGQAKIFDIQDILFIRYLSIVTIKLNTIRAENTGIESMY